MGRSRASAKKAGSTFERSVADYLAYVLGSDIDRRVKHGSKDTGDISGVFFRGYRAVLECKDYGGSLKLPEWLREAETEAGNDDAPFYAVVAKRKGTADPAEQYVAMPLRQYAAMVAGHPSLLEGGE